MKFLAFLISLVFVCAASAQKKLIPDDAVRVVLTNVVRTAYVAVHGTVDGFDPLAVVLEPVSQDVDGFGDVSPWIAYSNTFRSRAGLIALHDRAGRVYHVWPGLLRDKRTAKQILVAHYAG